MFRFSLIMPLASTYTPKEYETKINQMWQESGVGTPGKQLSDKKYAEAETYTNLMPPPNLTGNLHAGHAFGHYVMDTLTRIHRQKGEKSLWLPGVDHAGIQLEGVIDKAIKAGEFASELEGVDVGESREDWAKYLKKNNPEKWLELAWSRANEWRDNQRKQSEVLGDTPDYSRSLFTLDPQAVKMVNFAFDQYYKDGLIYKKEYLINWSVGLQTALSDVPEDIGYEKRKDPFVTFEYRWQLGPSHIVDSNEDNSTLVLKLVDYLQSNPILVSTVRPETIFADKAIAIHPNVLTKNLSIANFTKEEIDLILLKIRDSKFEIYFGIDNLVQNVKLILADEVDENFGTGALKITPAHDLVDYNIFHKYLGGKFDQAVGRDGKLTEICGEFAGQTVEEGRKNVIDKLLELGYIPNNPETGEPMIDWNYEHNVTICERSKTVVEPLISEEFFVGYDRVDSKGKTLKEYGLEGVNETKYYPSEFKNLATNYLENIKDWTISRDLLWGHKMPIWYNLELNPERKYFGFAELEGVSSVEIDVTENKLTAAQQARYDETKASQTGKAILKVKNRDAIKIQADKPTEAGEWVQEVKILDTWFSSCLWPLSTLDFAGDGHDFESFYKTQDMVTAREIFYAWIVRMTVLGKYFTGSVPFENVIITPTIQDEQGRKMSKSLKNGLDPVVAIESYSSDSLRMAMLGGMIPNRNMRLGGALADRLMEKYRNFGNKVWNIARFLESKKDQNTYTRDLTPASMWILGKYQALQIELDKNLESYELMHNVNAIYEFLWNDFADWYVEYLKTDETQLAFAYKLYRQFIMTLSPYLPFETQVIWRDFFGDESVLALRTMNTSFVDEWSAKTVAGEAEKFEQVIEFVRDVRSLRGLFAIDPVEYTEVSTTDENLLAFADYVKLATRVNLVNSAAKSGEYVNQKFGYSIAIVKYIKDKEFEIGRTNKEIASLEKQIGQLENQLANEAFVTRAEPEAVEQKRADLVARNEDLAAQKSKLEILK
jgi:valyl-tRNA synthetase